MSGKSRRKQSTARVAKTTRSDQRSDLKPTQYKIRRKIPAPSLKFRAGDTYALHDEQLSLGAVETSSLREAQPFLKWVGGKAQLLPQLDELFPDKVNRYFEPFVGGGAVFFHLKHRFPKMKALLRDTNGELINAYRAIRDFPDELMRQLDALAADFRAKGDDYFYLVRSQHYLTGDERKIVERAARMIFLNKTCFNGLWRVNASGKFNVPVGSNKKANLYAAENIFAASRALQGVDLEVQDFRRTFGETRQFDFIYVDPPYYPVSPTANFTAYTKEEFGEGEQRELHAVFANAAQRGVNVMLSNSDTPFIRRLYREFQIQTVQARRMVNCDGSKRGAVNEVVVTNKFKY